MDFYTIRAVLGYASLDTTNVYAEIDIGTKAKAMELYVAAEPLYANLRPEEADAQIKTRTNARMAVRENGRSRLESAREELKEVCRTVRHLLQLEAEADRLQKLADAAGEPVAALRLEAGVCAPSFSGGRKGAGS